MLKHERMREKTHKSWIKSQNHLTIKMIKSMLRTENNIFHMQAEQITLNAKSGRDYMLPRHSTRYPECSAIGWMKSGNIPIKLKKKKNTNINETKNTINKR